MQERHVNLVFQGGGVRGIAYAGVLSNMPPWLKITGAGGTSAGALVAALLAIGKREDLRTILSDPELFSLLRKDDVDRKKRIFEAAKKYLPEIQQLLAGTDSLKPPSVSQFLLSAKERKRLSGLYGLWQRLSKDFADLKGDLEAVWKAKGLHSSEPLRGWLDKVLEGKKFLDLEKVDDGIADLQIVAADVNRQEYRVYDAKHYGALDLAEAVHASVSIPIFFEPFVTGGGSRFLVDGGILSNYPSFLFAQSPNPTIGFRLEDVPPLTRIGEKEKTPGNALPVQSTKDFILLTLKTMVEAHDKFRELPPDFHSYPVPVPDDIPFDKFDLSTTDADRIFDKAAATRVEWEEHSRPLDKPRTFDPNPQSALAFGIEQGAELIKRFYAESMWADAIEQTVDFECRIEKDWSTRYLRKMTLNVTGDRPIILMRVLALGLPKGPKSLADHLPDYTEIRPDGSRKRVILVPASNEAEDKGFAAVFDPPVRGEPRTFSLEWRIKEEFTNVGRGGAGIISYHARQLAVKHTLNLKFRVLSDQRLGKPVLVGENGEVFTELGFIDDPETGNIYRVYESVTSQLPVHKENGVRAFLRRAL